MNRAAHLFSILFHPLLVPQYLLLFLLYYEPVLSLYLGGELKWRFLSSMFITTFLGPLFSLYIMKNRRMLDSLYMPELKGRSLAYAVAALYYGLAYLMLYNVGLPQVLRSLFIALIALLLSLAVISLRYKISAHAAGVGGSMGLLLWISIHYGLWSSAWFLLFLFLGAIVITARLQLQAHRMSEVASGYALGIGLIFFLMRYAL